MEDLENPFNGLSEAAGAVSAALEQFREDAAASIETSKRLIEGFFGSPE
jgi:hypothetical protein